MQQEYTIEIVLHVIDGLVDIHKRLVATLEMNGKFITNLDEYTFVKSSEMDFNHARQMVIESLDMRGLRPTKDDTIQWADEWYNRFEA